MTSWALYPKLSKDQNSACILIPHTQYIRSRELYTIHLGLVLDHIPNNTVVKIENMLPSGKILNKFWTVSHNYLTINLIAEHYTILKRGTLLCNIYLLPAECLVPGKTFVLLPNILSFLIIFYFSSVISFYTIPETY